MTALAVPGPRQVRRLLRRGRRAHSERGLGEVLGDAYLALLFVAIYVTAAVRGLAAHAHLPRGHPDPERGWLLAAGLVFALGALWRVARTVGPLLAQPASAAWCLSSPVDRRGWLLPSLAGLLAAGTVVGAAAGAVAAVIASSGALAWAALAWTVLATASGTGGLLALGVVAQVRPGRWSAVPGVALFGAGLAGAIAVTGGVRLAPVPSLAPIAIAAAGFAVAATVAAGSALPRLNRSSLTAGAGLATATVTAAIWLDLSLLTGVLEANRWRRIVRVRSRRFVGGGRIWVLVQAELRRVARRRSALAAWVVLLLVPYAVGTFSTSGAGVARLVAGYLAAGRLAAGLRRISNSTGLARAIGGSDRELRATHLVVPGFGLALWWALTLPAAPVPPALAVLFPAGLLFAVYRAATRPPLSYDGAMVDTPFGMFPSGLLKQLGRGVDVLGVLVAVQLVLPRLR
jgi:hypothetical protein